MGNPKVLAVSMVLLMLMLASAESEKEEEVAVVVDVTGPEDSDKPLKLVIEQLKSKISSLESKVLENARELKVKDEMLGHLEREVQEKLASMVLLEKGVQEKAERIALLERDIQEKETKVLSLESDIQEKATSIMSLQGGIGLLQKKGAVDVEELVGKAHARSNEIEKKLEKLKDEVDMHTMQRVNLEARAMKAENKAQELTAKLHVIEKLNSEQQHKMQKTEHAVQVAEEELMRLQLEATLKSKALAEVHSAWLPPWLSHHILRSWEFTAAEWNEHGKPTLNALVQKASEKSGLAQKWMEPHLQMAKTKWIPTMKEKWTIFLTNVRTLIEKISSNTIENFEVCRSTMTPHVVKFQEYVNPYVQDARKFSKPYIEQFSTATKPHVEKVRVILQPHTRRVIYGYGKFLKTAKTSHHQIQELIHEHLKNHELTKPMATKEFVWFAASAALALPIFLVYRLLLAIFGKKTTKTVRSARSSNNHRRHKRRHVDH